MKLGPCQIGMHQCAPGSISLSMSLPQLEEQEEEGRCLGVGGVIGKMRYRSSAAARERGGPLVERFDIEPVSDFITE